MRHRRFSQYEQDRVARAYINRKLSYSEQQKINYLRKAAELQCGVGNFAEVTIHAKNLRNPNGLEVTFMREGHKFKSGRFVSMSWVIKKLERQHARAR